MAERRITYTLWGLVLVALAMTGGLASYIEGQDSPLGGVLFLAASFAAVFAVALAVVMLLGAPKTR